MLEQGANSLTYSNGDAGRQTERIRQLLTLFALVGLVALGVYLASYILTQAWQMGVAAGGVVLGILLAMLALALARRGEADAGGYLLLVGLAVAFAAGGMAWSNATAYVMASGAVFILLAGSYALSRKPGGWFLVVTIFTLSVFLIHRLEPIPRFNLRDSRLLRLYVRGVTALSSVALAWWLVRGYRRIRTIRARLLVVSATTVLLTAIAISSGSIVIGLRSGRRQAIDRLDVVATLREVEIDGWVQDIQRTLASSLRQAPEHRFVDPEMATVVAALLDNPVESEQRRRAQEFLSYNFEQWLKQTPQFDAVFFMDREGRILVATEPALEGEIRANEMYFNRGTVGSYIEPLSYSQSLGRTTLFASRPVLGQYGRLLGVVAGRIDVSSLNRTMRMREQASLGETGETYLVGADGTMLTDSRFAEAGTAVRTRGVEAAVEHHEEGSATYVNYLGNPVIGVYRWVPDLQVGLIAEQSRAEALAAVNRTAALNGAISLVALLFAGIGAVVTARRIGDPLSTLAETASEIAAGDLERLAHVERRDEIGTLAEAFNQMTAQLRGLIGRLESRVAERTRELELRSAYLEASAEVGRAASAVLDAEELVDEVVGLIRDRFGLYYVGLFLVDEMGEWAELRAGTGEPGQEMLAQNHRLRVGGQSMIGQSVARSEARIALDVGEEPVRFDNPLLPETRSEAALPLESRGRVFGAITVQSAQPAAFDQDTLTVLETMADQVAVALDNAYLFREAEDALEAARRAQAESTREAWTELLRFRPRSGYHSDERGIRPAGDLWRPLTKEAVREGRPIRGEAAGARDQRDGRYPLAVPVKVAGRVVGVLDTYKPGNAGPWTEDEVETLRTLAERLGASLESARLHQETRRRAAREQLVSEISSTLRASMNPETILKTTAQRLGQALDAELASVEVTGPAARDGEPGANGNDRVGE